MVHVPPGNGSKTNEGSNRRNRSTPGPSPGRGRSLRQPQADPAIAQQSGAPYGTGFRTPRAPGAHRPAGRQRPAAQLAPGTDPRRKLLLSETDSKQDGGRSGVEGRGAGAGTYRVVRPQLHQAEPQRQHQPADL